MLVEVVTDAVYDRVVGSMADGMFVVERGSSRGCSERIGSSDGVVDVSEKWVCR